MSVGRALSEGGVPQQATEYILVGVAEGRSEGGEERRRRNEKEQNMGKYERHTRQDDKTKEDVNGGRQDVRIKETGNRKRTTR